jgi:5'-deoxynucleotidase YfbR-like HD superfamily hydrolase
MLDINPVYKAGKVTRWHTKGDIPPQSIADHSWGVAMLIMAYHPRPSIELIQAALVHDLGEIYTGDIPYSAKLRWPDFRDLLAKKEKDAMDDLGASVYMTQLLPGEKAWLKWADQEESRRYLVSIGGPPELIEDCYAEARRLAAEVIWKDKSENVSILRERYLYGVRI